MQKVTALEMQQQCIAALATLSYVRAIYRLTTTGVVETEGGRRRRTSKWIRGWVRDYGVVDSGFCHLLIEFVDNRMVWQGVSFARRRTLDQENFLRLNPTAQIVRTVRESVAHVHGVWNFHRRMD